MTAKVAYTIIGCAGLVTAVWVALYTLGLPPFEPVLIHQGNQWWWQRHRWSKKHGPYESQEKALEDLFQQ
jgi:hypothetical protein